MRIVAFTFMLKTTLRIELFAYLFCGMPRVQMTKTVKFALYFLRFYLVLLLILVAVRFIKGTP